MRTHVLKLGLVLVVLMYFALEGFPQASGDGSKSTRPILRISGTYMQGAYTDEAVVFFDPIAKVTFNSKTDANKLMNTEPTIPNIYTVKDDHKLAINGLPEITDDLVIPIGYDVQLQGTYIISASEIADFDTTTTRIYLEDLAMNVSQDLILNPDYVFNINPADKGSRFFIRFAVESSTGINVNTFANSFNKVYSNGKTLYVSNLNLNGETIDVDLFNMQGQKVFESRKISNGSHMFNLNQNEGVYLVRVSSKLGVETKKVHIY